ncbi:YceD family protein [Mycoplasma yeatsii]|uniref:Uncharacterized metal-binding protein YceD (DUF177 family) n=1 Tax=Mycoplasma yeatsii TaxID=51365 RepID=A0ABU0NF96_9MOLU|nr:DUF177 domain-containing protein [Mycoplasma yeatsii]MDQ0568080.1 uncharacterized metal-binding protein YceD (DUF177 family) [Mycoplasma yeatsii]
MKLSFTKQQLSKNKHQELKGDLDNLTDVVCTNSLVKSIDYVNFDIDLDYIESIQTVRATGVINYTLTAIDARTGKEIKYSDYIDWDDEYSFDKDIDSTNNIILKNEFDLFDYIIEQININLPFNLSLTNDIINKDGFGWTLLSEENFETENQNKVDPRWEKLDEFIKDKEKNN